MGYYDDTMARITRQQYDDYIKRFLPYEDKLIDLATNNELLTEQLDRNEENVAQSYESSRQGQTNQRARMGLANAQTSQQSTNSGLNQALTLASVQNETRQAVGDLQESLLSGAAGSAAQNVKNIGT